MLRLSAIFRVFGVVGLLGLAACAEAELVAHTAKSLQSDDPQRQIGQYKVGRPYQIAGVWYYPKIDYAYEETGIASWYGPGFDGKQTANGEIFDEMKLTAAHRTLPLPSMVRVTNLSNGRSIKLRVNDRGPFARNRIIDLSRRGAQLLGFENAGTAKVRVAVIEDESRQLAAVAKGQVDDGVRLAAAPTVAVSASDIGGGDEQAAPAEENGRNAVSAVPMPDGVVTTAPVDASDLYIQAGAFLEWHNANRLRARLDTLGPIRVAQADVGGQRFYRVQLGPVDNVSEADRLLAVLWDNGYGDAQVIVD